MEPCATYQNTHHQLTVVIGSQWGKTCWPFRFKLMSNIKGKLAHALIMNFMIFKADDDDGHNCTYELDDVRCPMMMTDYAQ